MDKESFFPWTAKVTEAWSRTVTST